MKIAAKITLILLLLAVSAAARRRDPLTESEADQLRTVAMEPDKRIKLLITFTEARLSAIDQVRVDPKLGNERGTRIHDLLEDFSNLMDEINNNLDQYESRKLGKDSIKLYHKGLKELIAADERFDLKLKAIKASTENDPVMKKLLPDFRFVLQDAEDSLKASAEAAREDAETTHEESETKKK
jgi:ElaB/YqjD/DUF883 family membrane-anchored ribosome-binding protein